MKYIVYVELDDTDDLERWYYGGYSTEEKAYAAANRLKNINQLWYCTCTAEEAVSLGVRNLPADIRA